jgi:hypothetical protein
VTVDRPRLLSRQSEFGDTDRVQNALHVEPEAVDVCSRNPLYRNQEADYRSRSTPAPRITNNCMRREHSRMTTYAAKNSPSLIGVRAACDRHSYMT